MAVVAAPGEAHRRRLRIHISYIKLLGLSDGHVGRSEHDLRQHLRVSRAAGIARVLRIYGSF